MAHTIHKLDTTMKTLSKEEPAARLGQVREVPYGETIAHQRYYGSALVRSRMLARRMIPLVKSWTPTAARWGGLGVLAAVYVIDPTVITRFFGTKK